jgi:hypothetical protein
MKDSRGPVIAAVAVLLLLPLLFWGDYFAALLQPGSELMSGSQLAGFTLASRNSTPEFPFEHPAAEEARRLFLKLDVRSEKDYRALRQRDRYLWDVTWFETEVMNGGMDQYFYNSAGDHAAECCEALLAIGATESCEALQEACALFPNGCPSPDREIRIAQMKAIRGNKYLDDLISEGDIEVDLYELMMGFYRNAEAANE